MTIYKCFGCERLSQENDDLKGIIQGLHDAVAGRVRSLADIDAELHLKAQTAAILRLRDEMLARARCVCEDGVVVYDSELVEFAHRLTLSTMPQTPHE